MVYSEEYYIHRCKRIIEKELGWDSPEKWRHSDYEKLSGLILAKTGVRISHITLKRLWGKIEFKGVPHINTLDALARFCGFENWMDFKSRTPDDEFINEKKTILKKNKKIVRIVISALFALLLLFVLYVYIKRTDKNVPVDQIIENENYYFNCTNAVGDVPHTVSFNYNLSHVATDNIYLQINKMIRIQLDKNKNQLNYLYYFPSYYTVNLFVDDKLIESVNVHVTTKGWISVFYKSGDESKPVLVSKDIIKNGILQLHPDNPVLNSIDGKYDYWVNYVNSRDFGLKADNFFFEARIKNDGVYEYHCGDFQVSLIGNNGFYEFRFVNPGCSRNVQLFVHSSKTDGNFVDLSMFETDLKKWHTVNFIAKGDSGKIYLDNRHIYTLDLFRPLDSLKAIRFKTRTNGSVDYVKLLDRNNDVIFYDDFE